MRSCPQCGARYTDDMRFCLHDGTTLVAAPTDDLSVQQTEQFNAQTIQDNDPSAFRTLPSADTEPDTVIAPPKTQQQYTFSAVEPASRMGCTMTFGKVAAALLFVAGLGLAGIIFTYKSGTYTAGIEPSYSNTSSVPKISANANRTSNVGPGVGGSDSDASNTVATSNRTDVSATPAATRTPPPVASTSTPAATPMPKATATPPGEVVPTDDIAGGSSEFVFRRAGNLNGRAISLPQPAYPPAARAAGVSGPVDVRVLVDENGTVIRASAVNGHPLLRQAAVAAARQARFPPPGRGPQGRAIRVNGVLRYNFP